MLSPHLNFTRKVTVCLHSFIPICADRVTVGMVIIMESLETVRMLKAHGVGVIFEKENIDTRMESGELHVAVFHELARMESESLEKSHGCPCRYRCIHVAHRKE